MSIVEQVLEELRASGWKPDTKAAVRPNGPEILRHVDPEPSLEEAEEFVRRIYADRRDAGKVCLTSEPDRR